MPCNLSLEISKNLTAFVLPENQQEKCFLAMVKKKKKERKKKLEKEKKEREEYLGFGEEVSIPLDDEPSTSAGNMRGMVGASTESACASEHHEAISSASSSSSSSDNEDTPAARKKTRLCLGRPFGKLLIAETEPLGTGFILVKKFFIKNRTQFYSLFTAFQRYRRLHKMEIIHEATDHHDADLKVYFRNG